VSRSRMEELLCEQSNCPSEIQQLIKLRPVSKANYISVFDPSDVCNVHPN